MTCKQVREELLTCWGSTEELGMEASEHLRECPECAREALLLRETHALLGTLPAERAPHGLTERVLAEIVAEGCAEPWWSRIAAWFVPEGQPAWARAAAVGVAVALAVAGGPTLLSQHQAPLTTDVVANVAPSQAAAGPQFAAGRAELDELMLRHHSLEYTQPLSDDPGITMVMYTSN